MSDLKNSAPTFSRRALGHSALKSLRVHDKGGTRIMSSSVVTVLGTLGSRVRDAAVELGSLTSILMLGFQNGRGGIQDQVNITAAKGQQGQK